MKCNKCGSKIKKDDVFCPECGKNLKENILTKIGRILYNNRIKIFVTLIFIILLISIFNIICYVTGPVYMAKKYIKAAANNNYTEIYNLLDVDDSVIVSKKIMKEKIERLDIDAYKLDEVNIIGDEALVTFKYEYNNEINYVSVLLRNSMIKKYYLFDNWKILSSKVANNVVIKVPKNSIVKLDNINIKEFKKEEDNYDIYSIDEMFVGEYKILIELEKGLKIEDNVNIKSNETYTIGNIELEDKIKENLINQLESTFNNLYSNAINEISYNDTGLNKFKYEYNYLKESLKNNNYILTDISFSDIDISEATYTTNLEVTFNLNCNYTVEYKLNEEVKTYSGSGNTKVKVNFNVEKDIYTLDSISNLPISFRIRY